MWLAHNNDTFVPELWGYATVRDIAGRVPTMCFGLQGDVDARLREIDRDDGMLLFAVAHDQAAVFECTCASATRRDLTRRWLVGTNHISAGSRPTVHPDAAPLSSFARFDRLVALLIETNPKAIDRRTLARFLADDGVECRDETFATAYATVACPSRREIWFTFGGTPAASRGTWAPVPWPWPGC